jgi:DNA-binding response OmpR family regulator
MRDTPLAETHRIPVVDDDPCSLGFMKVFLGLEGYGVEIAAGAEEALQ